METNLVSSSNQNMIMPSAMIRAKNPVGFGKSEDIKDMVELSKNKEEHNKEASFTKKMCIGITSIVPGLGQILNGEFAKGVMFLGAGGLSLVVIKMGKMIKNKMIIGAGIAGGITLAICSVVDAVKNTTKSKK